MQRELNASGRQREAELVDALRQREEWAVRDIYARYGAMLLGIIRQILRDDVLAEDVLQDVLLKAWDRFNQYDEARGALATWLSSIARSAAIDAVRSRAYREAMKNRPLDEAIDAIDRRSNTTMHVDGIGLLSLVRKLRPEHRAVVHKVYYEGYTHEEAARALRMPLGTVKTRLRAALRHLRTAVAAPAYS